MRGSWSRSLHDRSLLTGLQEGVAKKQQSVGAETQAVIHVLCPPWQSGVTDVDKHLMAPRPHTHAHRRASQARFTPPARLLAVRAPPCPASARPGPASRGRRAGASCGGRARAARRCTLARGATPAAPRGWSARPAAPAAARQALQGLRRGPRIFRAAGRTASGVARSYGASSRVRVRVRSISCIGRAAAAAPCRALVGPGGPRLGAGRRRGRSNSRRVARARAGLGSRRPAHLRRAARRVRRARTAARARAAARRPRRRRRLPLAGCGGRRLGLARPALRARRATRRAARRAGALQRLPAPRAQAVGAPAHQLRDFGPPARPAAQSLASPTLSLAGPGRTGAAGARRGRTDRGSIFLAPGAG